MDALTSQHAWDEALERLLAFLNLLEIGGAEHRTEVALRIFREARENYGTTPDISPVVAVMRGAARELEKWYAQALPAAVDPLAAGIVARRISDAAERWPDAVLGEPPPEELKAMLAAVEIRTGPEVAFLSMTPREMDYGAIETIANETWHQFAWTPIVRAALLWTGIFFIALYCYDRFFPTV